MVVQSPHVCKFTKTIKTLDILFPPHLKFVRLRRKFRESMLVSEENGRRCFTPQGTVGYIFEKEKQLTQYYYKIHPYSKFRQYWEMIAIIEMVLSLTIRPFIASQLSQVVFPLSAYQIPALFADLFELSDVALRFLTGYMDKGTQTVTLETRKVFSYNLQQIFLYVNLIASFPFEFIIYVCWNSGLIPKLCVYSVFTKIFKLNMITKYLTRIGKIYNWSELCLRIVWTVLMMFLLTHWLSCLFYLVIYGTDFGEPNNYFSADEDYFFRHCTIFYMISSIFFFQNGLLTHLSIKSKKDIMFCTFILVLTHLANIVFIGLFVQLLGLKKTSLIYYKEMIQEVQKFLIQENLPKHIHKKVMKYFEFRFQYRYFQEKMIMDTLSPPLKREIANFLCLHFFTHVDSIFYGIPQEVASDLCLEMKFEMFLPGDNIIRAGRRAKKMYFINCGTVALFTYNGKEIAHLNQGQYFGESAFILNSRYLATVIALELSECYVLTYRDFLKFADENPDYVDMINERVNKMRLLYKSKLRKLNLSN